MQQRPGKSGRCFIISILRSIYAKFGYSNLAA
jgi:hypothetical protein